MRPGCGQPAAPGRRRSGNEDKDLHARPHQAWRRPERGARGGGIALRRLGGEFSVQARPNQEGQERRRRRALYLEFQGLQVGWGKVDELRHAIADFRKSGKQAYAYLEESETKDYLVAVACDEVFMPAAGWLMVNGMRAEISFYKDLFDWVGVKADMLQMGDFKGAAEPYTRSGMSKEFRQQLETVIDDYYEKSYVNTIVRSRRSKSGRRSR